MIRSLVTYFDADQQSTVMKRNPDLPQLESFIDNPEAYLWIDIIDLNDEESEWLATQFKLSPAVIQDLQREDRRPSLLVYPSYLFLSLFQPHIHAMQVNGREIHCVVMDRCFITVRTADATAVDNAYERAAQNVDSWSTGIAYFLYLTSQFVVDAYYPLLDRISNQLNSVEEALLNTDKDNYSRKPVYRIKQQLINLRQMVAPQREVFSSVIGEKRLSENSNTRDLFRHLYERLLRVYDVIDSQRDLSSNVLDIMQNQESQKMVEAVNRLTIFSMIFLPLTFFTGLFELNFATTSNPIILPIDGRLMFVLVVAAMLGSAAIMAIAFRRRGWL